MLRLIGETYFRPTDTIRQVLAMRLERSDVLKLALVVACIGAVASALIAPEGMGVTPFVGAAVQIGQIFVIAILLEHVGRMFGGTGSRDEVLTAVVWHALAFLPAGIAIEMMIAGGGQQMGLLYLVLSGWALVVFARFAMVVHGFANFAATLAGTVGAAILIGILLLGLAGMLGLAPNV